MIFDVHVFVLQDRCCGAACRPHAAHLAPASLLHLSACPPPTPRLFYENRTMMRRVLNRAGRSAVAAASPVSTSRGAVRAMSAGEWRTEKDTMGDVDVPADRLWGAQTQRSLQNFKIGGPSNRMPIQVIKGASRRRDDDGRCSKCTPTDPACVCARPSALTLFHEGVLSSPS